jgi:Leucine-rich repeat (LRR) protein
MKLKVLSFRDNVIESVPESIGELKNLEFLDLRDNLLSNLPNSICRLSKLKYLDLKANELKSIPVCLESLQDLTDLNVSMNEEAKISSLIPVFQKMKGLKYLDISYNGVLKEQVLPLLDVNPNCRVVNRDYKNRGATEEVRPRKSEMYQFEKPVDRK